MSRKILLTVPEEMLKTLNNEKNKYMYNTIQEVILSAIRDKYLKYNSYSETKKSKSRKIDPSNILFRKKAFSKHGKKIEV